MSRRVSFVLSENALLGRLGTTRASIQVEEHVKHLAPVALVLLALASCTSSTATSTATSTSTKAEDPQVNANAKTLQDFKERLDRYVEIRKKADDQTPPLKKTDDPAEIKAAQDALAQRIRAARADAKPGDILTPEIAASLRRLLRPEVKDPETKEAIKDDNPGSVPFKVNEPYPEKAPLSTVPPNVLETLPMLPKDIEYRFVGKHLILRDVRADLIIDYMLNAIP